MAITTTQAGEKYKPFPYFGSQIMLASQRIHLHAKDDSVLLLARKSIGLQSLGTLNLDCDIEATINSPKIYLGLRADQQLVLGTLFFDQLNLFLVFIQTSGELLQSVGEGDVATSMAKIAVAGKEIKEAAAKLIEALPGMLSNTSYTL